MLYYKYSENRIFFLSEYWILIPSAIIANYFIVRKIRADKKNMEALKRLKAQLEQQKKLQKIAMLALGVSGSVHFLTRGGSTNLIDTDYIKAMCDIDPGIRYLDDLRLKNIVTDLYRKKRKGKVIYIPATALCHIADRYGRKFLALPVAVGDFGITSLYETARKTLVVLLWGGVAPVMAFNNPFSLPIAFILAIFGLKLALINVGFIPTSPFDSTKNLEPGVRRGIEVVVINNRDNNKIIMRENVQKNQECWLPDQRLLNKHCKEIIDVTDSILPNVGYEETVNMKDVTGLVHEEFTNKFDLGQTKSCQPPKTTKVKTTKVEYLEFLKQRGDLESSSESEGWDRCENDFMIPEKKKLRTRNKP